ncbi:yjiA [Symbiodinium microadriaticum]|nr:yjiA [Symbiodinium microadriaticum]
MPWHAPPDSLVAAKLNKLPLHDPAWLCGLCFARCKNVYCKLMVLFVGVLLIPVFLVHLILVAHQCWGKSLKCWERSAELAAQGPLFFCVLVGGLTGIFGLCVCFWWLKSCAYRRCRSSDFHYGYAVVGQGSCWEVKFWMLSCPNGPPPRGNACDLFCRNCLCCILSILHTVANLPMLLYSCFCGCDQVESLYLPTEVCVKGEEVALLLPEPCAETRGLKTYASATFLGVDEEQEPRAKFRSADGTVYWFTVEDMCDGELCFVGPSFLVGQVRVSLDDLLDMDSDCNAAAWSDRRKFVKGRAVTKEDFSCQCFDAADDGFSRPAKAMCIFCEKAKGELDGNLTAAQKREIESCVDLQERRIRATILTGFLGAGKTTFLNFVLKSLGHGRRIAVVQNEFGKVPIDDQLMLSVAQVIDS